MYEIEHDPESSFPVKEVFAQAVGHIANGLPINELGNLLDEIEERISFQPVISQTQIKGTVVHIDHHENVLVNISRELFDQVRKQRSFAIHFKRFGPICHVCQDYAEVAIGEILCRFHSTGLLEIAVNTGKASSLLGTEPG